jgi:predicted RNA binding protein YcfA (HicA-like mRNA interferase family)
LRKYTSVPAITGKQLIALLIKDGWVNHRSSTHGQSIVKKINDRNVASTIKDSNEPIPTGTLGAILSVDQTRLGKRGLLLLINKYGLE